MKWEDRDNVNDEPSSQIPTSDLSATTDECFYFVIVGREEGEDDISEEDNIDEELDHFPVNLLSVEEAHLKWSVDRRHHDHTEFRIELT